GGLSLPNKDYYTKTDDKSRETRDGFVKHVARMFELLGDQPGPSAKAAETVMRIEMQLADVSMTPVERRNPAAQDNKRTIAQLGEALGKVYVEKQFSTEAKVRMDAMIDNLVRAYRERIQNLDWMSAGTRQEALLKLEAFTRKIGNPPKWKDYSSLRLSRDSYFLNARQAMALEEKWDIEKIDKPVDKTEWSMTPPTVNAYYSPPNNEIVFPAGILQPPFFDPLADEALN